MKPSDSTLDASVIRIYRDALAHRAGASLSLTSLVEEWPKTNFRKTDLIDSLARLEAQGVLKPIASREGVVFELTAEGARLITEVPVEAKKLFKIIGSLVQTRGRSHSAPGTALNRRDSDRSEGNAARA